MNVLDKVSKWAAKITAVIAGLLVIIVFSVIFIGIIGRILGRSPSWTEELSRWGLIAICFSGTSTALYQKQHVGVNILIQRFPFKIARILTVIAYLSVIAVCVYFGYYSLLAAVKVLHLKGDIIPFSMIYVKLFLPFGFVMLLVQLFAGFFKLFDSDLVKIEDVTLGK